MVTAGALVVGSKKPLSSVGRVEFPKASQPKASCGQAEHRKAACLSGVRRAPFTASRRGGCQGPSLLNGIGLVLSLSHPIRYSFSVSFVVWIHAGLCYNNQQEKRT